MKTTIALSFFLLAAVMLGGCDGDKIKLLNDQVSALGVENTTLKAKIGDLEKTRTEMTGTLSVLQADRDQAKKANEECAARDKPKDGEKTKDGVKAKGNGDKGGAGKDAAATKGKPGVKGKPTFKPPKKVK
jgi:hypothetical protein